jgi:hypothetical protein
MHDTGVTFNGKTYIPNFVNIDMFRKLLEVNTIKECF